MNMLSIIISDIIQYCETYRVINYFLNLIKKRLNIEKFWNNLSDKEGKTLFDNKKLYFSYIKIFMIERGEEANEDIKQIIPDVSFYFNRGESLQVLS